MSAEAPRSGPPTPRSSAIGTSRGSPTTAWRTDGSIRPGSLPVEGIDFGPFPCTSLRRAGQAEHRTREIRRGDVCPLLSENALIGKPVLLPVDDLRTLIVACDDLDLCSLLDDHTTLPASAGRSGAFVVEARHHALMRLGPGRAEAHAF